MRGDYLNVFVTFDLTLRRLGETVFTTSKGLDPNMKRMNEIITRPTSSPEPSRTSRVRPPTRSRWHRERRPSTRRRRDRPAHEDPADDLRRRDSADGRLDPIFYLRLPEAVGLGSYKVTANFVAGGGLYENANVTFRGVTVGRVETVGLTDDGVVAHMRLQSGTPVPENVTVTVKKSVSAVGEQYIDLVPPEQPAQATLRNGAEIGVDRTAIGQDIYGLLQQADALVSSVGDSRVQDLLRETFKAFNGSGPELAQLIQSSRLLIDEANANYGQTTQLIDQAGPLPGCADSRRGRHQVARRRAGQVHRRGRQRGSATAVGAADRSGSDRDGEHDVRGHQAHVPGSRGEPGQLRADRGSSTTSRSSTRSSSSRPCSPRSTPWPAAFPPTRAASWTSRSTSAARHRAR